MYAISTSDFRHINRLRSPHPIQTKKTGRFSLCDKNTQTSLFVCNIHRLTLYQGWRTFLCPGAKYISGKHQMAIKLK